jgi:hypothetical protein
LHALILYEGRFADDDSGEQPLEESQESSTTHTTGEPMPEDRDAAAALPDPAAEVPAIADARDRDSR